MAQITPDLIAMIRRHAERGEHAPLTINEVLQLAHAWEQLQELNALLDQIREARKTLGLD